MSLGCLCHNNCLLWLLGNYHRLQRIHQSIEKAYFRVLVTVLLPAVAVVAAVVVVVAAVVVEVVVNAVVVEQRLL